MWIKKLILFRRTFWSLLAEALLPVLFVLVGFMIMRFEQFSQSNPKVHETKLFPLPQRLLVNQEPIIRYDF